MLISNQMMKVVKMTKIFIWNICPYVAWKEYYFVMGDDVEKCRTVMKEHFYKRCPKSKIADDDTFDSKSRERSLDDEPCLIILDAEDKEKGFKWIEENHDYVVGFLNGCE
jgi:hypothetical protein